MKTRPLVNVPTAMRGLLFALWLAMHLPAGAQPDAPEYLTMHTERLLQPTQLWGVLGINVAAHDPTKPGEPLRIGSQTYTNGFGHHATGKIEVLLNGEFARFEAEVGLQPCPGGTVVFRVSADGATVFDSGVMRSGDAPRPVRVSVADVEVLTLEALDAGDGIACDMANWVNPRLIPAAGRRAATVPDGVNIARFAQVVASDPNRLDGARANRLEEFRAEDVFLERELAPDAEGNYTLVPDGGGSVSIGLKWSAPRALTTLAKPSDGPDPPRGPERRTRDALALV